MQLLLLLLLQIVVKIQWKERILQQILLQRIAKASIYLFIYLAIVVFAIKFRFIQWKNPSFYTKSIYVQSNWANGKWKYAKSNSFFVRHRTNNSQSIHFKTILQYLQSVWWPNGVSADSILSLLLLLFLIHFACAVVVVVVVMHLIQRYCALQCSVKAFLS